MCMLSVDWLPCCECTHIEIVCIVVAKLVKSLESMNNKVALFDTLHATQIRDEMLDFSGVRDNREGDNCKHFERMISA